MQRNCTIKRLFSALVLVSTGLALGSGTVFGFVVGRPSDLEDADRWSNIPGSLVEDGVRGLGGGIEYAIADDFCFQIIQTLIDETKPTCEQIKEIIQRAFDKWAVGHPILKFVDVTGKIKPELPPAGRDPARGYGAEIDLFVQPAPGLAVPAMARWFTRQFSPPMGTNGRELPGNTITNADIIFNMWCFFIDPALLGQRLRGLRCAHFETVLMHEIGHTLGLHHPDQFPLRNYDSDDDPTNEIPIDCEEPAKGLKLSPKIDPKAIMAGGPAEARAELTNDDIGGRNFLYPICPSASADAVSAGWARGQTRPTSGD